MAQRDAQLKTNVEQEFADRVEDYRDARDMEYTSDAVQRLVRVGLREDESPIMYRVKDSAIKGSVQLVLVAACVALVGAATPVLAPFVAGQVAALLVVVALGGLATAETIRLVAGRNEIGAMVRGDGA